MLSKPMWMKRKPRLKSSPRNFLGPIRVTEETLKVLKEMGVDFVKDPPPPLFHVKQISVEPLKRCHSDLMSMKFEYSKNG
jgi:hypothetical protein